MRDKLHFGSTKAHAELPTSERALRAASLLLHSIGVSFLAFTSVFWHESCQPFFFCCTVVFACVSSLLFLRLPAQITPASRLTHPTATLGSGFCVAGVHLFLSPAITFKCHTARTILQLLRFNSQFCEFCAAGKLVPQSFQLLVPQINIRYEKETTMTTFVLPLAMCWDSTVG